MKLKYFLALSACLALSLQAQNTTDSTSVKQNEAQKTVTLTIPSWAPHISGTIRTKGEYQTEEKEGRFEVRNARVAFDGNVLPNVIYKAEIDFSDEGQIKMLDAYAGIKPFKAFSLRLGQMRVPFSIDAHRSPHQQYFANRSFIAKQVGNVRDVGLTLGYTFDKIPLTLEAGTFNGSGLTNQKDYWTKTLNFSAKAQYTLPFGLMLQGSVQKISPNGGAVYLYDGGATLHCGNWTIEGEYLRKHYTNKTFSDVNAMDAFVCYCLPLQRVFDHVSFLARYDLMGNHSNGQLNADGVLQIDDAARKRVTGGVTFSFSKRINADIRLNYEKYFYDDKALAKPSERDKAVIELMVHF